MLHPLLVNYYGVTGPVPQDYPRISARVSPDDFAYINTLFPGLHNRFDVIVSTLYARFIAELKLNLGDDLNRDPVYEVSDPRLRTLFTTLFNDLAGCPTRRDFLLDAENKAGSDVSRGSGRLREAQLILEGLLTDTAQSPTSGIRGVEDKEAEEGLGQPSGGVAEGVAVDQNNEDLFALLRR